MLPILQNPNMVRGGSPNRGSAGYAIASAVNGEGDTLISQAIPERTELVRLGKSYSVQIATANHFTFVATIPTTRAELLIYNNASLLSGICLVIDRAWMINDATMGAAQPVALLGQVCVAGLVAAPTDGTTTVLQTNNLSSKNVASTRAGSALFALANTAFCLANHWQVLGNGQTPAPTTNLGVAIDAPCYGRYIITPQGAFGLAGLAGTAAGTAIIGVDYHEVILDLG